MLRKIRKYVFRDLFVVLAFLGVFSFGLMPTISSADVYDSARNLQSQMNEAKSYQDMKMRGIDLNEPTPVWAKVFWAVVLLVILIACLVRVVDFFEGRKKIREKRLNSPEHKSRPYTEKETADLMKHIAKSGTSYQSISEFADKHHKSYGRTTQLLAQAGALPHNPLLWPVVGDVVESDNGVQREVLDIIYIDDEKQVSYCSGKVIRQSNFDSWAKWCKKNNASVIKFVGVLPVNSGS